jgi:UDP-2,3-diacylglucosamine pyrophosphatase LpxH
VALAANHWFNKARLALGFPYWSLSAFLKHTVKNAVNYIGEFENAIAAEARRRGADGVVCGHIHKAEMREIDGVLYCNDGDWVESCTALVEHLDGMLEIVHWADRCAFHMMAPKPVAIA